jgi:multiple sugar transport system substrate-binding protein
VKIPRFAAVAATLAITGATLTGCSAASDGDTLQLWMPPFATGSTSDEEEWNTILTDFEEENDVDVQVTIIPWETFGDKLLAGFSGGEGPDIVYMFNELIGDYLQQNALAPFDLSDTDTSDYLYLDRGVIDDEQYTMPFMVGGARVLYYNKTLLAEAGVTAAPTTWEEFEAAGEKLVAAGITPLVQAWGDPGGGVLNDTFYELLWQAGGDILSEDRKTTAWNSPEGLAAAEYLNTLNEKGILSTSALSTNTEQAIDQFASGDAAFFVQVDAEAPTFAEAGIDFGWIDSLTGEQKGTFVATDSLVMANSCDDKALCTDLAVYLTSTPAMEQFHSWADFGPVTKSEPSDSEFQSVYEQSDILVSLPVAAGSVSAYNALYSNLQQMLLGEKSPAEALEDSAAEADAVLEEAQN